MKTKHFLLLILLFWVTSSIAQKAKTVLKSLRNAMEPTKKYTDDQLVNITNKLSVDLMEVLGISLSGIYLSYSIVNMIGTSKLTPQQLS